MNKYLAATALTCLFATSPAFAQSSTATGVGVANSSSSSKSGAVAISGQGGRGGNSSLTINNPANTTSTVNSNVSGTTTQNVNSTVSGTTTQNVNQHVSGATTSNVNSRTEVSGTQTLKNVPSMVAPGLTAAGLETCLGSASGGASVVGFGATFGTTVPDPGCQARLDARTLWAMGLKGAAVARLCIREDIWRSMPDVCAKYTPVVTPAGNPLVAPAPYYMSTEPKAERMGGTSIEVIDGKTGLTRPCDDYNAVRQKCLNWADAPKRTKLAATSSHRPKKTAALPAAVKPAVASVAVEPKKED
jgi:hypothetical protein